MTRLDGNRRLLTIGGLICFLALFAFQYSRIADANSLTWDEAITSTPGTCRGCTRISD